MRMLSIAALLLAIGGHAAALRTHSSGNPIVSTPYGQVEGITELDTISAFRAIPFAQPPVGQLRFSPTVGLKQGWNGVLDGTKPSAGCMASCPAKVYARPSYQCASVISEDCLYMNVFTPTLNTTAKLPVVVYFHGGNFMYGSGVLPMYDGASLAQSQNIVVVTTNYRLGVFGGLYTGNVKGNFQILDQRQALIFVSEVIESFGGDKNSVTISGQSAGAFSVATHLTTPASWPYFHKAIMMSNPSTMRTPDKAYGTALGNLTLALLGCGAAGGNAATELACLQAVDAHVMLNATDFITFDTKHFLDVVLRWGPVVDGEVIRAAPYDILTGAARYSVAKVPVFMGTTQAEAAQFVFMAFGKPLAQGSLELILGLLFNSTTATGIINTYGAIPADQATDARPYATRVLTDYLFYCTNRRIAAGLTGAIPTGYTAVPNLYFYHYSYQGSWTQWLYGTSDPECVTNVCHAEDVPAVFNSFATPYGPKDMPLPTAAELVFIGQLQRMWGSFVYTGSPGTVPSSQAPYTPTPFPPYSFSEGNLVQMDIPFSFLSAYHVAECNFWDRVGYVLG